MREPPPAGGVDPRERWNERAQGRR
jgi:hypothetical protein